MDKLREKLRAVAEKEKETAVKNRRIFTQFKQGDLSFASDSGRTSASNNGTPAKSVPGSAQRSAAKFAKSPGTAANTSVNMTGVLDALEEQRTELFLRNKELELQVRDLVAALKDVQNRPAASRVVGSSQSRNDDDSNQCDESRSSNGDEELTPVARQMYDKILQQQGAIEQLLRQGELAQVRQEQSDADVAHLRAKLGQLREESDNLRLEMEARPSVKQWTQTQRELRDLEDKLGDLTVMRGDSAEIAMWRKHLSTADRIKIDKRNHELGLWLLDSLPKTVMKEVLQAVCRELDVTDISDILQCVVKLKAVVKTVPRMERFISQVCAYVFERDPAVQQHHQQTAPSSSSGRNERSRQVAAGSTMEDVFPMLKRWARIDAVVVS